MSDKDPKEIDAFLDGLEGFVIKVIKSGEYLESVFVVAQNEADADTKVRMAYTGDNLDFGHAVRARQVGPAGVYVLGKIVPQPYASSAWPKKTWPDKKK